MSSFLSVLPDFGLNYTFNLMYRQSQWDYL